MSTQSRTRIPVLKGPSDYFDWSRKVKARSRFQEYEKELAIVRGKMKSGIEAYKAFETAMADLVGEDEE